MNCSKGKKGYFGAGAEVGADDSAVCDWAHRNEAEGVLAFFSDGKNKLYPPEVKEAAVKDFWLARVACGKICGNR